MSRTRKRDAASALVSAAVLLALPTAGAAGGVGRGSTHDVLPPSAPAGIRVTASSKTVLLTWTPSADNLRVAGYDVYLGSLRERVRVPTLRVRGFACGQRVAGRVVAFDRAHNRSKTARATIQIPGCSLSTPGWFGGFDTGDISQWDSVFTAAPDRFRAVTSDGGVIPRQASHMARVEVRPNEAASWTTGANVSMVEKTYAPAGSGRLGDDTFVGFSVFLPNGFPYPNQLMNNIFEWHGDSNEVQASVHLTIDGIVGKHYGISNRRPGFVLDLHTEAGYNPVMFRFGDLVTGRWVDFVVRTKWATDGSGIIEGWMDGVKKFSSSRPTWYSDGSISRVKPELGTSLETRCPPPRNDARARVHVNAGELPLRSDEPARSHDRHGV
ncbi:MAG: heparin lyase I family protein [Actinobacteria bacterium]|nr:heparin lyase I family protein [Actinomycetota bacterium]